MENLNKTYSREELIQSIPDFISGKISDSGLSNEVRKLIETDSEFKNEFEELRKTLSFFAVSEFPEPPDNYFNNLSVRINERLNPVSAVSENNGIFQYFSKIWKYVIPALAVILIALFFVLKQENSDPVISNSDIKLPPQQQNSSSDNSGGENQIDKNENLITGQEKRQTDPVTGSRENNAMTERKKTNFTNYGKRQFNSPDQVRNDLISENPETEIENVSDNNLADVNTGKSNPDFADIFDMDELNEIEITGENGIEESDLLNSIESDDINLQNEFRELSPADQQEILNVLKETKI